MLARPLGGKKPLVGIVHGGQGSEGPSKARRIRRVYLVGALYQQGQDRVEGA